MKDFGKILSHGFMKKELSEPLIPLAMQVSLGIYILMEESALNKGNICKNRITYGESFNRY